MLFFVSDTRYLLKVLWKATENKMKEIANFIAKINASLSRMNILCEQGE